MTRTARLPRWATTVGATTIVALIVAAGVLAWLARSPASSSAAAASTTRIGLTSFPVAERQTLPEISGTTLLGEELALSSFVGKVLVINVWGSWCAPCRAEAPILARISKATFSSGVRFVGIDVRDNVGAARAFERSYGITYPSLFDADGTVLLRLSGIIPVSAVPSTVVVDPARRVAARVVGKIDEKTLRGLITDVLAEPGPPPALGRRS